MVTVESDLDRHLSRVRKLLALAGSTVNEHETGLAVVRVVDYLNAHPLPLRWYAPQGTTVRVVPVEVLHDLREAGGVIREVRLRKGNWFFEDHRVKDVAQALSVLRHGYMYFQRYGFALFVPIKCLQVFV